MVSVNPIMVDGTGMCGGCRVKVGDKVRFACVDGPDFDGHLVDFEDLMSRLDRYKEQEQAALAYMGAVIQASPVGIISYDETGQARAANQTLARMVGGTTDQLLQMNFRQIESWRTSGLLEAAERAIAMQEPVNLEAHFITTFCKEVWLDVQFVPFQRGDAWHLLLLATDISDRAHTSVRLKLLSAALDAAANTIVITDPRGQIEWVNEAFTRGTGYTRSGQSQ